MKLTIFPTILLLCLIACWPTTACAAEPMGSAFTYQGHLYDANYVADGLYDFQFSLFDDPCTGIQIGSDVNVPDVDVIDGYFTVELDFTHFYAFIGQRRWLEIGIRPGEQNDPCEYTVLSPRQEITPTPYAINADKLDGVNSTSFASSTHYHDGSDITTGIVAEACIHDDIARDSEIMPQVLANDGSGSTLDADLLDGSDSAAFASTTHTHSGSDIDSGTVDETYIDADITRDTELTSGLATKADTSHSHDGSDIVSGTVAAAYIDTAMATDSELSAGLATKADTSHHHDGSYVNVTGDSMSGSTSGSVLSVSNTGSGYGIYGEAAGGYRGVYGAATSTGSLINYGGYFTAAGNYGRAVRGDAPVSGNYNNYGGYFTAAGGFGRGVYGEASNSNNVTNHGGYFTAAGQGGIGVYGEASNPNDVTNYGGYFVADGNYGYAGYFTTGGKYGTAGYFNATGTNGTGISAQGGTNGYAAMFYGDVLITGGRVTMPVLEITGGSDLSERFEVTNKSEQVRPGMVVSIDAQNPGNLVVSTKAYDRRVAGIISGAGGIKPGMLMGQEGSQADGADPVALTGRVHCWAEASNGSIEPGDLLTTSDTPGHAMKVTDYDKAQGAILGKAMSSLKQGQGLVLVLVNLQ